MSSVERVPPAEHALIIPNKGIESPLQKEKLVDISADFTHFLRRSHALMGEDRDILDFDLAREDSTYKYWKADISSSPTLRERSKMMEHLDKFAARSENIMEPRGIKGRLQLEFLRAKIKAHIAFFERKFGLSDIDPFTYIEETMGIRPSLIPEDYLARTRKRVVELFEGLSFGEYNKENIDRYRSERAISDEDELIEWINLNSQAATDALAEFIGVEINPRIQFVTDKKDEYWLNWASGDREDGFELKINTHQRHKGKWTPGKLQIMPIHEVAGHFAQMTGWLNTVDKGELIEALGLTSTHDPGQFTSEGIAQTLPLYVPAIGELLSPEAWLEFELGGLREMVYNNVHYSINKGQFNEVEIIESVQESLPAESEEEIKKEIKERTQDPVLQAYRYAYGIGFYWHRRWADKLTIGAKRKLLRAIYSQPMTPVQEKSYVSSLLPQAS